MSRISRSRLEHLVVEREPVNISQIASKSARSSARSQTPQSSFTRILNKFVDVSHEGKQAPFSFRKHSGTENKAQELTDYLKKTSGDRGKSKPGKPIVPMLPLEQVREDVKPSISGLSSINYSMDSAGKRMVSCVNQDLDEQSQELTKGEENSLLFSPLLQQKTYSRLDESSIVDPMSNIIIEDPNSAAKKEIGKLQLMIAEEKENNAALLRLQSQQFEAKLTAIQHAINQQQTRAEAELKALKEDLSRVRREATPTPDPDTKENLASEYKQALRTKETRHEEQTRQRLLAIKKEYEVRLKQQQDQLQHIQQHNSYLKDQLTPQSRLSEGEQKAVRALLEENEALRKELAQVKERLMCSRCKCECAF